MQVGRNRKKVRILLKRHYAFIKVNFKCSLILDFDLYIIEILVRYSTVSIPYAGSNGALKLYSRFVQDSEQNIFLTAMRRRGRNNGHEDGTNRHKRQYSDRCSCS